LHVEPVVVPRLLTVTARKRFVPVVMRTQRHHWDEPANHGVRECAMTALVEGRVLQGDGSPVLVEPILSPLAYAYMRVPPNIPDDKVRRMEYELRRFAEGKGFCFGTIFYEFKCGMFDAFEELLLELQRAEAHDVVMPSYRHLARSPLLQNSLLTRLEFDAHAEVHVLRDTTV